MSFASRRGTASTKQIGKMRHLAGVLREGDSLLLAMARDERVRSMRADPRLLGHPVEDDLRELSMFEASHIIDLLAEGVAEERDAAEANFVPRRKPVTVAQLLEEGWGSGAPDADPLGAELEVWVP